MAQQPDGNNEARQSCGNNTGAPQPTVYAIFEQRKADNDEWYCYHDFVRHYGGSDGQLLWNVAGEDQQRCYTIAQQMQAMGGTVPNVGSWLQYLFPTPNAAQLGATPCALPREQAASHPTPAAGEGPWAVSTEQVATQPTPNASQLGASPCTLPREQASGQPTPDAGAALRSSTQERVAMQGTGDAGTASSSLAQEPVAQPPAPDATQLGEAQYVLTLQQVGNFLPTVGSKHARQECRRLREWCLNQWPPVHRVRMTHQNAFSWQCLLRSMHAPLLQQIFGTAQGIIECNFLLQEHSRDADYDGPRHVFEFVRTDGVRCHIHFHSGRRPDPLIFVEPWDVSLTGIHVETADYTETI